MLPRALLRATPRTRPLHGSRRAFADSPAPPSISQSRIDRFNRRLPAFLHKHTRALGTAPLAHMTAFLLLHELTAIVPLFSLAAYFHYTHWLPPWFAEGAWVASGVERFGRYFKRKGWIRSEEAVEARVEAEAHNADVAEKNGLRKVDKAWDLSEGGVRLVVEFATAYAITKMFLVPRIMFSVWATPWFARWTVVPLVGRFKSVFARGRKKNVGVTAPAPGAGTGAVEGGVVSKIGRGQSS